jgi:ABC-type transport system involved in multi-copper enzyme maturation permease subunit
LALLLTTFSVLFVRKGAKVGEPTFLSAFLDRFRQRLRGERTRPPRTVWSNPVAWREAKTRASGGWLLRWTILLGGFAGPLILLYYRIDGGIAPSVIHEWLAGLIIVQLALALIVATNTAATSITKEKESKSMELLLTTPLTSRYILWGKLRGLVSFALPLLFGPVSVLLLFAAYAIARPAADATIWLESVVELGALLIIYTAFGCVVGLWRSLNSKTNVAAVMHSLAVLILACGIASLIGFGVVEAGSGAFGAFLAAFTPFTAIRYLVDPRGLFATTREFTLGAAEARVAALFGSTVATILYAFIVWRLYAGLVRNFDMTLRKQSSV